MEFCKVTLTFESADEILWCDYSNENSSALLSRGTICFSKFYKMKFGNLVEICFWLHLAVKGFRDSKSILGNMQAQAPVHVANVQVGRGHRQLPSELDLPFSSQNEQTCHRHWRRKRALVVAFNHRFLNFSRFPSSVTSLRTRVWNWTQCITYLNATPFVWNQMKLVFCLIFACSARLPSMFDCVRLAKFWGEFD